MDAYVILGDPGSGKSTTIRHLTGRGRNVVAKIDSTRGPIRIYVHMGSLQEKAKSANAFIAEVGASGANSVIFSLWIRERSSPRHPTGAVYLAAFEKAGWNIKYIEALWVDDCPQEFSQWRHCLTPIRGYTGTDTNDEAAWCPSNRIAAEVRARWGWI